MYGIIIKDLGYLYTIVFIFIMYQAMMTFCCACLLIHLAYYLMGYYIRLIRDKLLSSGSNLKEFEFISNYKTIKTSQRIFGLICRASAKWNHIFALPALAIISTKLLTVSCNLFNFIQGLIMQTFLLSTMRWTMLANILMDVSIMAIIFTAVDIPVEAVSCFDFKRAKFNLNFSCFSQFIYSGRIFERKTNPDK